MRINTFQPCSRAVRSIDSSMSTAKGVVAVSRAKIPMVLPLECPPRVLRAERLGT